MAMMTPERSAFSTKYTAEAYGRVEAVVGTTSALVTRAGITSGVSGRMPQKPFRQNSGCPPQRSIETMIPELAPAFAPVAEDDIPF